MLLWCALVLLEFTASITAVILLGLSSTARYEREQQARTRAQVPTGSLIGAAALTDHDQSLGKPRRRW